MDRYYNQDEPEISDLEYDTLMQQLKKIELIHPEWVTKDSPTQKIGGIADEKAGGKVTHDVPMLSIEDVFSKEDVVAWYNKVVELHPDALFSVEAKIDGLSMTIRYEKDGDNRMRLSLAETRGDGLIGEDVTKNAMVIDDVLHYLSLPYDSLQLRGEVYMTHEAFEEYNFECEKNGKKLAANPRNLAAGSLRQLDPEKTKSRKLKMFVFNVQQGLSDVTSSHSESLDLLEKNGVKVVSHKLCSSIDEIIEAIDDIAESRAELDFDIDGAVVKVDQIEYRDDFPAGSKYSSGHIAYKYPPEEREVVVDDIIVDVGRTGKLTFIGAFYDKETKKPARLCGTSVSRATLHNKDYINEMHIGIGGTYKLYKSGEIIPKFNGCVEEPTKVFVAPDMCPVCGSKLIVEDDTADTFCFNPNCHAQLTRTVAYFASIDAMNIIGLGENIVEKLVGAGYIDTFSDIYNLGSKKNELVSSNLLGGEKTVSNLLNAIEQSKTNDPAKLLTGLGIRNVGKNTAKSLMKHFESISALQNASYDDLIAIEDIGDTTAKSIVDYFNDFTNTQVLFELEMFGLNMVMPKKELSSDKLNGLTIVVTGTLPTLGRKEVTELIEDNGGKCTGSVSKKTDYLVAGDAAGSKLTKAQTLGIPVITEEELLKMIQG